jgi:hypothetical protein
MDRKIVEQGLQSTASVGDRLRAFKEVGIPTSTLISAVGVSESTLRNWAEAATESRPKAFDKLDILRVAVGKLVIEKGIEPEQTVTWLISRESMPPYDRPVDMIAADEPLRVFEAISELSTAE